MRLPVAASVVLTGGGLTALASPAGSATAVSSNTGAVLVATAACVPKDGAGTLAVVKAQAALDIPDVVAAAKSVFGESYAGFWIDNCGNAPVINVMASGTLNNKLRSDFDSLVPQRVRTTTKLHQAKFSGAQLVNMINVFQEHILPHLDLSSLNPSDIMITVDPRDNAVVIVLPKEDAKIVAALRRFFPPDSLRVEWVKASSPSSPPKNSVDPIGPGWVNGDNNRTFPPYMAGLVELSYPNIFPTDGETVVTCTSGFTLEENGAYYGVTAGHCFNMGATVYSATYQYKQMGTVTSAWHKDTGGDYAVFKLYKQQAGTFQGQIMAEQEPIGVATGAGSYSDGANIGTSAFVDGVTGRESDDNQGYGLTVCYSGVTSDAVNCGTVTTEFKTIIITDPNPLNFQAIGNLMCESKPAGEGDSGGPVYVPEPGNAGLAAGTISLDTWNNQMCYTTIDSILQGMTSNLGGNYNAYVVDYNGKLS